MNKAAETIGNLIESKSGSKITSMKNTWETVANYKLRLI